MRELLFTVKVGDEYMTPKAAEAYGHIYIDKNGLMTYDKTVSIEINKAGFHTDRWIKIEPESNIEEGKYIICNKDTGEMGFAYYSIEMGRMWQIDKKAPYQVAIIPTHYQPISLPKE